MRNGVQEVTGMVIKSMPVGERDRRVTLMTLEQGKLSFFAHGAGKPGNPFMGVTRPFSYGKFFLYQRRDSYSLESAEIANYFENLSGDLVTTCYATYFLELADYYAHEFAPEPGILKLLYLSFLALQKPSIPKPLTRRIFELRMMVIDGSYDPLPPLYRGGREPASGDKEAAGAGASDCTYTWHYICTAPLEQLFRFNVTEGILTELGRNVDASLRKYADRQFHSLEILEMMN
ncbi:MAG: DNA repair protein RecO [Stomatobaculum sp.]|nr:DNA repair protein RecO [Stomatobaculum sp.]